MQFLLLLLAFIFCANPANAAVTFQLRGTQLDAWYANSRAQHGDTLQAGSAVVSSSVVSGVFGGSVIDTSNIGSGIRALTYPGMGNFAPNSTGAISILLRILPKFNGPPSAAESLIYSPGFWGQYKSAFVFYIQNDGSLGVLIEDRFGNLVVNTHTTQTYTGWSTTTPIDIYFVWDGTTTAGAMKFYLAPNGSTATLLGSLTASYPITSRSLSEAGSIVIGDDPLVDSNSHLLNEAVIWDTVINPVSFGVRTGFITPPTAGPYEGYNQTALTSGQVVAGTVYGPGPGSLTGTAVAPLAATTKHGVAASDGTGTYFGADWCSDPGVSNVRSTASYISAGATVSGNYVIPTTYQVQYGATYGIGGTGSTGRLTCTQLSTNDVVTGVAYTNFAGDFIGSYVPGGTIPPGNQNVRAGTIYALSGVGQVGTMVVPPANKVQAGYAYDDGTVAGTLACTDLTPGTVASGTSYTTFTGAHTGTLGYITNQLCQAKIGVGQLSPFPNSNLVITQGDTATFQLRAMGDATNGYDLTGAVFQTSIKGSGGTVIFANAKHTANPDQTAHKGEFTLALSSADTATLSAGINQKIVIKVTQGSNVIYFHGDNFLQVLSNTP